MLFKILHGDASRISTDITPFHEGYCYVTYDGSMYVDMNLGTETAPNNKRVQLNAKDALTSIEAQALVNQNNGEQIKLWIGTQAELDAIDDRDDNCIYFTTDYFENMDSIVLNSNNKNSENKFKVSIDDDSNVVIENITLETTSVLAEKPAVQTITLPLSGWDRKTLKQTVVVNGVVADQTKQIITIASDTNCMAEYVEYGTQCVEQGVESLVFMVDAIPTNDFVVYVTIQDCM